MDPSSLRTIKSEQGMALVVCLMIMVVMALIVTGITTNSTVEIKISGNQRNKAVSFNNADVGTGISPEVIEQNLEKGKWDSGDSSWVDSESAYHFLSADNNGDGADDLQILVNEDAVGSGKIAFATISSTLNNAITIRSKIDPLGRTIAAWETIATININKTGGLTAGNAIQMAAGYEGKGKSSGGGGYQAFYLCESTGFAGNNTTSINEIYYRHIP